MDPFARLAEVAIACVEGANPAAGGGRAEAELDTRADRVTAAAPGRVALEAKGDKILSASQVVSHETQAGAGAVGKPEIEIPIAIPVTERNGAAVIDMIEAGHRGDIGEAPVAEVEEAAVLFFAAEGPPLADQPGQLAPGVQVGLGGVLCGVVDR